MNIATSVVLTFGLLQLFSFSANACSCVDRAPDKLFADATSIFVAQVTKAKLKPGDGGLDNAGQHYVEAQYRLIESLKGNPRPKGVIFDADYQAGNCSVGLRVGVAYLFLLYGDRHITICGGTQPAYKSKLLKEIRQVKEASEDDVT